MISAVLDTNTFISAILFPSGIPGRVLARGRQRQFNLITGAPIITETLRALTYPHIKDKYGITPREIERLSRFLRTRTLITPITAEVSGVATHPADDLILAVADSAAADYLVTGDRQLRRIGVYKGVKIVSPREFLEILDSESGETGIQPEKGE